MFDYFLNDTRISSLIDGDKRSELAQETLNKFGKYVQSESLITCRSFRFNRRVSIHTYLGINGVSKNMAAEIVSKGEGGANMSVIKKYFKFHAESRKVIFSIF